LADDPLHAEFEILQLGDDVDQEYDYEALSYTWADAAGDAQRRQQVFIGSYWDSLPITNNCASALKSIRMTQKARLVWVDAICINQADDEERAAQIKLMQKIYKLAARVVVYVGEEFPGSRGALRMLDAAYYCGIFGPLAWRRNGPGLRLLPYSILGSMSENKSWETVEENEDDRPSMKALGVLIKKPYFKRLWVVQEFLFGREKTIHCGKDRVHWPSVFPRDFWRLTFQDTTYWFLRPWPYGFPEVWGPSERLWSLILDTYQCLCSDPRDKIFGILGLVSTWKEWHTPIETDYSLSVEEVYIGIAAYFCTTQRGPERSSELLQLASCRKGRSLYNLPSWVPDWSDINSHINNLSSSLDISFSVYYTRRMTLLREYLADKSLLGAYQLIFTNNGVGDEDIKIWHTGFLQAKTRRLCPTTNYVPSLNSAATGVWRRVQRTPPRTEPCPSLVIKPPGVSIEPQDLLFWLYGAAQGVILRPIADSDSATNRVPPCVPLNRYLLVATCNLYTKAPNHTGPPEERHFKSVRRLTADEKHAFATLCGTYGLLRAVPGVDPEQSQITSLPRFHQAHAVLTGILYCIKTSRLLESEIEVWKQWETLYEEISWIFRDPTQLQQLLDSFAPSRGIHEDTPCEELVGGMPNRSISFDVLQMLWSQLKPLAGTRTQACDYPPPGIATRPRNAEPGSAPTHVILSKLEMWAELTESLLKKMQETSTILQQPDVPGSTLPEQWARSWLQFQAHTRHGNDWSSSGTVGRGDDDNMQGFVQILKLLQYQATGGNAEQNLAPMRLQSVLNSTQKWLWDMDVFRRDVTARVAMWESAIALDQERGWTKAMFDAEANHLNPFDDQIKTRAELFPMGLDFDTEEDVLIC